MSSRDTLSAPRPLYVVGFGAAAGFGTARGKSNGLGVLVLSANALETSTHDANARVGSLMTGRTYHHVLVCGGARKSHSSWASSRSIRSSYSVRGAGTS